MLFYSILVLNESRNYTVILFVFDLFQQLVILFNLNLKLLPWGVCLLFYEFLSIIFVLVGSIISLTACVTFIYIFLVIK